MTQAPDTELRRLLDIMAALRDRANGCPWDQVQTYDSIAPYTIEEAYEVADAIARRDYPALQDELGDLLFQVVYHAQMAHEEGRFDFADVAKSISDKMIRRHPHVFGDAAARDAAARVRFDWPDAPAVLDKFEEEIAELRAELPGADPERMKDEVGDLLFVMANLARKLGLDPETCLRHANDKFTCRFNAMERAIETRGDSLPDMTPDAMEEAWQAIKRIERGQAP